MANQEQIAESRNSQAFWSYKERLDTLHKSILELADLLNLGSVEKYFNLLQMKSVNTGGFPGLHTFRRFLKGQKTQHDPRNWTALLVGVVTVINEKKHLRLEVPPSTDEIISLYNDYLQESSDAQHAAPTRPTTWPRLPDPNGAVIQHAMALIRQYARLDLDDEHGEKYPFFERDKRTRKISEPECHFICYRFHTKPGQIAKSFVVMFAPNEKVPCVYRFATFFPDKFGGQPRRTNGIIVPTLHATYLIGEVYDGGGLEVMALRNHRTIQNKYDGLLLSFDLDRTPVAARFVMARTTICRSSDAGIGVFSQTELGGEVGEFIDRLRNRVPFVLEEAIKLDGHEVDQDTMVEYVKAALKKEGGGSRLTVGGGGQFNPAADKHYTYNSALRIWSTDE